MSINMIEFFAFIKELIANGEKLAKFKEIVSDIKELIKDVKDVIQTIKG